MQIAHKYNFIFFPLLPAKFYTGKTRFMAGKYLLASLKQKLSRWLGCCRNMQFIVRYAPDLSQFDLVTCTFPIASSQEGDLASLESCC